MNSKTPDNVFNFLDYLDEDKRQDIRKKLGDEALDQAEKQVSGLSEKQIQDLYEKQFRAYAILCSMYRADQTPETDVVQEMVGRLKADYDELGLSINIPALRSIGALLESDKDQRHHLETMEKGFSSWLRQAIDAYCDVWEQELDDSERVFPQSRDV